MIVHVIEKPIVNEITVSVEDVVLPEKALIMVTAIVDGEYIIDVNGTLVTVNVTGGKGNNSVELPAGDYYEMLQVMMMLLLPMQYSQYHPNQ